MIALVLALLGPASGAPVDAASSPAENVARGRIERVVVRSTDLDPMGVADAVRLRRPALEVRVHRENIDIPAGESLHGFCDVRRVDAGLYELALILSDGRAWFRRIESQPDQATRSLATALANLIAAIEDDAAAPDKEDVPLPVDEQPWTEATPAPTGEADPAAPPQRASPVPPSPKPVVDIGVSVHGGAILGLAPHGGVPAGAGGVGLWVRHRTGALVGVTGAFGGRAREEADMIRGQISVHAGYALRHKAFELPIAASFGIDPWAVRYTDNFRELGEGPIGLFGVLLEPGYLGPLGKRASIRVGPSLRLSVGGELEGGFSAVTVTEFDESPVLFRLGGVELATGISATFYVPVWGRRAS